MTILGTNVACQAGGTTILTLSFESQQAGSSSDRAAFRIVRRRNGQSDVVLPSAPQFYMGGNRDIRSWTFIDVGVPDTATYAYVVQLQRIAGGGSFYAMALVANHYRR